MKYLRDILIMLLLLIIALALWGWCRYFYLGHTQWKQVSSDFDHKLLYTSQSLDILNTKLEKGEEFSRDAAIAASWLRQLQVVNNYYFTLGAKLNIFDIEPVQIKFDISTTNVKLIEDLISSEGVSDDEKREVKKLAEIYKILRKNLTTSVIINGDYLDPYEEYNRQVHKEK